MPSPADHDVRAAVAAAPGGAISFEAYMELVLYGPNGFYTRPEPGGAGRRRDFLTSPEVGPLFGAVVARLLDAEWKRLQRPDELLVVDLGAGPGTLARAARSAAPRCSGAMRYVTVERSPAQRAEHPDGVVACASVEDVAAAPAGVVLANEVLDNVPFRLAVHDGAWREAFVTVAPDGRLVEVLSSPFDPVPEALPDGARHGARAPLQERAARVLRAARGLLREGSMHVIDYARRTTAEAASLDWRQWLRTYRRHERAGHYLDAPGEVDITADVMLDQLDSPDEVITQAELLRRWGIDELADEGAAAWRRAASAPTLEALRMRSRTSERAALVDPEGLGAFTVASWRW